MDAPTPTRTPLHAMSDEQLLWYASDELGPSWKRELASELLNERAVARWEINDTFSRKVPSLVERINAYHA